MFLIKIDIEGFEPLAFLGAKKIILESPPRYIFSEIQPKASEQYGSSVPTMLEFFINAGYRIFMTTSCREFPKGYEITLDSK